MPPTNATEEIIEKKAGSPVATSCLIIAVAALLAAIILQLVEMGEYRKGGSEKRPNPGIATANADIATFKSKVEQILQKKAAADTMEGGAEDGAEGNTGGGDEAKPGEPDAKTDGDEDAAAPVETKAAADADEAAPGENKGDEAPADADGAAGGDPADGDAGGTAK